MMAAFHLHNREAKRKLKVYANGKLLAFFLVPTYLGLKLVQITHVPPLSRDIAQKNSYSRYAFEATCGFEMERWR